MCLSPYLGVCVWGVVSDSFHEPLVYCTVTSKNIYILYLTNTPNVTQLGIDPQFLEDSTQRWVNPLWSVTLSWCSRSSSTVHAIFDDACNEAAEGSDNLTADVLHVRCMISVIKALFTPFLLFEHTPC